MPADLSPAPLQYVYAGDSVPAWIATWDLTVPSTTTGEALPGAQGAALAAALVEGLLKEASVARGACTWFGWNPFRIELPQPWTEQAPGPFDSQWAEARLFCEPFEVRLRRGPAHLDLTLLTEDPGLGQAAKHLGEAIGTAVAPLTVAYRAIPGELFLVGRELPLPGDLPPGTRADVRYPRLLRYVGPGGAPVGNDPSAPVRMRVARYFDDVFRLRTVRYRSMAG